MTAAQMRATARLLTAANNLDRSRLRLTHDRGEFNVALAAWRIVMRRRARMRLCCSTLRLRMRGAGR